MATEFSRREFVRGATVALATGRAAMNQDAPAQPKSMKPMRILARIYLVIAADARTPPVPRIGRSPTNIKKTNPVCVDTTQGGA